MSTKVSALVVAAILTLNWAQATYACSYPIPPTFRESIERASSIFIFRLEAAELRRNTLDGGAYSEWVEGRIRIVQTLKGDASSFKTLRFSTYWCGGLRLDVGHYFLIVTNARGANLDLAPDDRSILDISTSYSEEETALSAESDALRPVYDFLEGKPLPANYPPPAFWVFPSAPPPPPPPPPPGDH